MKAKLPVIWIILFAAALATSIMTYRALLKTKTDLETERYKRMVAEESLEKAKAKCKSTELNLKQTQKQLWEIQDILKQEKQSFKKLQAEFNRMIKVKQQLEDKLNESLIPSGRQTPSGNH